MTEAEAISPLPAVRLSLVLSVAVWITITDELNHLSRALIELLMSPCSSLHQSMSSLERKLTCEGPPPSYGWGRRGRGLPRGSRHVGVGAQSTCCQGLRRRVVVCSDPDTTNPAVCSEISVLKSLRCSLLCAPLGVPSSIHSTSTFEDGRNNSGCSRNEC